MLMFNLTRGSTLGTPLFDNRKCNPLVASAAISAGASLLGGLFGGSSQSKINKANQQFEQQQALQSHNWAVQDATTAFNRQQQLLTDQQNYNSPVAARARLEQAGYNPFLADDSASGNVTSVPNVQQADEPSQPAVMQQGSALSGLAQGLQSAGSSFASMYSALASSKAQISNANFVDSQNNRYQRQSGLMIGPKGGVQSYAVDQQFYASVAQIQAYMAAANRDAANTVYQTMLNNMYSSVATDEAGNVIYNADGSAMSNMQYDKSLEQQATYAKVQSLTQDAIELAAQGKNIDVDTLLKKYDLNYLMPQQLTMLQTSTNELNSQIALNNADAHKAYADAFDSTAGAFLNQAFTKTENAMRKGRVQEQNGKGASGLIDSERFSGKANKFMQGGLRTAKDVGGTLGSFIPNFFVPLK